MIVKYSEFLENIVYKAKRYPITIQSQHSHFVHSFEPEKQIYFRKSKLPELNILLQSSQSQIGLQSLKEEMLQLRSELKISQAAISKYIFKYDQVIISYPYVCFKHRKFDNLLCQLNQKRSLSFPQKVELLIEISKGLQDLHEKKISMPYLRSTQIVVNKDQKTNTFNVYFTNLRSAIFFDKKQMIKDRKCKYVPSIEHNQTLAPEMAKKIGTHVVPQKGKEYCLADIWSLGIIFYQTFFNQKIRFSAQVQNIQLKASQPSWLGQFICRMLKQNPKERTNLNDILRMLYKARLCSQILSR